MNLNHEDIRTFAYLHSAAEWALEQAEASRDRCMFPSMHAILASVHCIEAFTNHIGPRYFSDRWDRKDAHLATPKEKLRALLTKLGIDLAAVQSEYDSFVLALQIRKQLTHGRTYEIVKGNSCKRYEGSVVSGSHPDWHRLCEPRTARRVFEAVTAIIERMGEASKEGRLCWGIFGGGFGWKKPESQSGPNQALEDTARKLVDPHR
jgi:hypothetical protein